MSNTGQGRERQFPQIYHFERGYHTPSVYDVIDRIQDSLIIYHSWKSRDAREEARRLSFGYLKGEVDQKTLESYL